MGFPVHSVVQTGYTTPTLLGHVERCTSLIYVLDAHPVVSLIYPHSYTHCIMSLSVIRKE